MTDQRPRDAEPLSEEDEASVRYWLAQHEFTTPTLGHGVAALDVLPKVLATLDRERAARTPSQPDPPTNEEVREWLRAAQVPLHGHPMPLDAQASYVGAVMRSRWKHGSTAAASSGSASTSEETGGASGSPSPESDDDPALDYAIGFITRVQEYGFLNRADYRVPGPMEKEAGVLLAMLRARLAAWKRAHHGNCPGVDAPPASDVDLAGALGSVRSTLKGAMGRAVDEDDQAFDAECSDAIARLDSVIAALHSTPVASSAPASGEALDVERLARALRSIHHYSHDGHDPVGGPCLDPVGTSNEDAQNIAAAYLAATSPAPAPDGLDDTEAGS